MPWAQPFAQMATDAALDVGDESVMGLLGAEIIAAGKLQEDEASPVSIILTALDAARSNRDHIAADEVVKKGLWLLAKWDRYLAWTDDHPDLTMKPEPPYDATKPGP